MQPLDCAFAGRSVRCKSVDDTIVLAHAPLVGPSSWKWAAETLDGGAEVVVPDLHQLARGQLAHDFADALASVIHEHESVVLAGHSGAGPLLPLAVERARSANVRCVFVDAAIPPPGSPLPASPAFREQLEALVEADGLSHDSRLRTSILRSSLQQTGNAVRRLRVAERDIPLVREHRTRARMARHRGDGHSPRTRQRSPRRRRVDPHDDRRTLT